MERQDQRESFARLGLGSLPAGVQSFACSRCRDRFYVQGGLDGEPVCSPCQRILPLLEALRGLQAELELVRIGVEELIQQGVTPQGGKR